MIQIILLLLFMDYWSPPTSFASGKLLGEHICQIEIIEPVEILTWELKNKTVRTYKWCMNVPPRCSKYDQQIVNQTKTIAMNNTRVEETCCSGYQEQNGYCVSSCGRCVNGLCVRDICWCQQGWQGHHCDSRLSANDTRNIEDTFKESSYNIIDRPEKNNEISTEHSSTSTTTSIIPILVTRYTPPSTTLQILETTIKNEVQNDAVESDETKEDEKYIDYREFSVHSTELSTPSSLNVTETVTELKLNERNLINDNNLKTTIGYPPNTLLRPVLSQDDASKKYKSDFSSNVISDEKPPRKHASVNRMLSHDDDDDSDSTGRNLIYSICAASLTTVLILIVVISVLALRRNRKVDEDKKKKKVATVAVYTTSIFHTPLPEPPSFENPTYTNAVSRKTWNNQEEAIEFNNIQFYPASTIDRKTGFSSELGTCFYDHPPSSGSYRASSEVDALSIYSVSRKPPLSTVPDPVYDEIPSSGEYSIPRKSPPVPLEKSDKCCLYVNTCGSTKF